MNYPAPGERKKGEAVVSAIEKLGAKTVAVQADISQPSEVDTLVSKTLEFCGNIDVLVNNAGIAHGDMVEDLSVETWVRVINVHLRGTFLVTRAVLPRMYEQNYGRIVNTVSQLVYKGAPGLSAYTAAKGGILSFSRSLALEVGPRNVRVNCVAPGATNTPILDGVQPDVLEAIKAGIPVGHFAEVENIAPAYVFLASNDGEHFQGQCISPNGGDCFL